MRSEFKADRLTAILVGLMLAFQLIALFALTHIDGLQLSADNQTTDINLGVGYVALIIVESLILIGAWRLYKRLSDRSRKLLKYGAMVLFIVTVGGSLVYSAYVNNALDQLAILVTISTALTGAMKLIFKYDLGWLVHDLVALGVGVGIAVLLGSIVAPIVVIPVLVLMIAWDHYAVNLSDLMGEIIEFSTAASIPNYLIIPNRLCVDTDAVQDYVQDMENNDKPKGVSSIIGVGDFGLPAILTTSAWVAGNEVAAVAALVGACGAMVVLRDAMERHEGGLPALPWLNTGALGGYAVGLLVTMAAATL